MPLKLNISQSLLEAINKESFDYYKNEYPQSVGKTEPPDQIIARINNIKNQISTEDERKELEEIITSWEQAGLLNDENVKAQVRDMSGVDARLNPANPKPVNPKPETPNKSTDPNPELKEQQKIHNEQNVSAVPEKYTALYNTSVDILEAMLDNNFELTAKTTMVLERLMNLPEAEKNKFITTISAYFNANQKRKLAIWLYKLAKLANNNEPPKIREDFNQYLSGQPAEKSTPAEHVDNTTEGSAGAAAPDPARNTDAASNATYEVPPCKPTIDNASELNHLIVASLGKPMLNTHFEYLSTLLNPNTDKATQKKIASLIGEEIRNTNCMPLKAVFGEKLNAKTILKTMLATNAEYSTYRRRIIKVKSKDFQALFNGQTAHRAEVVPIAVNAMLESILAGYMDNALLEAIDLDNLVDVEPLLEFGIPFSSFFKGIYNKFKGKPPVNKNTVEMEPVSMTVGMINQFYRPIDPNIKSALYEQLAVEGETVTPDNNGRPSFYLYEPKGNEQISISDSPIENNFYMVKDDCLGTSLRYFITETEKKSTFTIG